MKKLLYLLIIFTLVISCQKEENFMTEIPEYENPSENKSIEEILTSKAVIGKKLPNPYSVDIMKQAFNNLKMETKSGLSEDCIEATHHYIVFKPSCHAHYRSLIMDEELDFYPYPLDHEVSDGWVVLDPDPEYSTNGYQHRWGYVPVEKDLSHIECPYEILYDIYAPDEEVYTKSLVSESVYEQLEQEAHAICGMELIPIAATKAEDVTPSGNITYQDSTETYQRYIGCSGMSVRANRLTKKAYGHCDENGDFVCDDSFKYNWTYNVYFSRTDFEMRRDYSTEEFFLKFSGYHGPLNLRFDNDAPDSEYFDCVFYCEILRAACKYYYGDINGLNRPFLADEVNDRMYIQAVRGCHPTDNYVAGETGGNENYPQIKIFRETVRNGRLSSDLIYGFTIHELAHMAHAKAIGIVNWNNCQSLVRESYAMGIEWFISKNYYPNRILNIGGYQTDIIKRLVEGDGVHATYSVIELETALTSSNVLTWNQWRDNIINYYSNRNEEDYVKEVFEDCYYSE